MKEKFSRIVQQDFESRDVVMIATRSQLRLERELEANKAKAEQDGHTRRIQKAKMDALFAKLAADGQVNSAGCSRPKNPFSGGQIVVQPLTGASNSAIELENSPTIENIIDWTTNESKVGNK